LLDGWQDDQIGRNFAKLVIAYFGLLLGNYRHRPHFGADFFHDRGFAIILAKKWVGLNFGRLFDKLVWSPCLLALRSVSAAKNNEGLKRPRIR
jgi:hypothetical protein